MFSYCIPEDGWILSYREVLSKNVHIYATTITFGLVDFDVGPTGWTRACHAILVFDNFLPR